MAYSVFTSITVAGAHAEALRTARAKEGCARPRKGASGGGLNPLRLQAWPRLLRRRMSSGAGCGRAA